MGTVDTFMYLTFLILVRELDDFWDLDLFFVEWSSDMVSLYLSVLYKRLHFITSLAMLHSPIASLKIGSLK